jgi:hypothetical protein
MVNAVFVAAPFMLVSVVANTVPVSVSEDAMTCGIVPAAFGMTFPERTTFSATPGPMSVVPSTMSNKSDVLQYQPEAVERSVVGTVPHPAKLKPAVPPPTKGQVPMQAVPVELNA